MADLEDLGIDSILDTSQDEVIERLRQIRLSRRIPVKSRKTSSSKSTAKAKSKAPPRLSAKQAENLLNLLDELEE